MKPMRYLC